MRPGCAVLSTAVLVFASQAIAQSRLAHLRVTKQEHTQHVVSLELEDVRLVFADALFDDYERQFDDALKSRQQALEWMWSNSPDADPVNGYDPELTALTNSECRSLDSFLHVDLRRLEQRYFDKLSEFEVGEGGRTEALRRRHLHRRLVSDPSLPWEAVRGAVLDVLALVDRVAPDQAQEQAVRHVLVDYELQLDPILRDLDKSLCDSRNKLRRKLQELRELAVDPDCSEDELDRQINRAGEILAQPDVLCGQVRHVNQHTIDAVAAQLPAKLAGRLRVEAHRTFAGYMHEGGTMPVRNLIERGLALDDLTDDQHESLLGMRETFDARESATTAQLEAIYEEMMNPAVCRLTFTGWARAMAFRDHSLFNDPQKVIGERLEAGVEKWRQECHDHAANVRGVLTDSQWERIQ